MVFLQPVNQIAHQERLDLRPSQIEFICSPFLVIIYLVKLVAVESRQPVSISAEMSRNPVEDNAYPCLVQFVDEMLELLRRSVSACRCIVTCHLIAPRTVKRMLHHRHQFHVGVAHILKICRKLIRKFVVSIKVGITVPRTVLLP